MESSEPRLNATTRLIVGAKFSFVRTIIWLAMALVLSFVVAGVAFVAAQYAAPLGLFPLLVGAALGGALVLAMRIGQFGHRPVILLGTLFAAMNLVVGQHYASYRYEQQHVAQLRARFNEKIASSAPGMSPELFADHAPQPPASFFAYMRQQANDGRPITAQWTLHGAFAWGSWYIDGLLQGAAALLIVWWASRAPYCGLCGSWYRTVRKGIVNKATLLQFEEESGIDLPDGFVAPYCSLKCCVGGCGPTLFELEQIGFPSGPSFTTWLSDGARDRVTRILDTAHR